MKTKVLSDHTGDIIAKRKRGRQQQFDRAMADYRKRVARRDREAQQQYDDKVSVYKRNLDAWNRKNWSEKFMYGLPRSWATLVACVVMLVAFFWVSSTGNPIPLLAFPLSVAAMWWFLPRREPRRPPTLVTTKQGMGEPLRPQRLAASEEEQAWQGGDEGERRIVSYLDSQLNDDWTLISGYFGGGGEIDQILVGPRGVCAIETKNYNGAVNVEGDIWTVDRYDNYGNLLKSGELMQDAGGRSPSAQINGAVNGLEKYLSNKAHVKRIFRAVILAHDNSRVGRVQNQTVDHIVTLAGLRIGDLFQSHGPSLDRVSANSVIQLIEGSHKHYEQRSGQRRQRSPRTA